MTNEEFQRIVLEELKDLKVGQGKLEGRMDKLEEGQKKLEGRMDKLEEGQKKLEVRMDKLEEGQKKLEVRMDKLENRMDSLEGRVGNLEEGQRRIIHRLDGVIEQTVFLTEFREETNLKLDRIIEENQVFKEILGRHEVDIRMIQKRIG